LFAAPDILSAHMSTAEKPNSHPLTVIISAGEASGEMYGAQLVTALQELCPNTVTAFGMGGERMKEAGCELVVDARDVAVVGLFEVLSHLPRIYREFHKLLAEVDRRRPNVAVLIDFPDWNLRLAKQLHRRGIPVVYYVSPQLWAWRKSRLKLVQRYVREMLVIIPFEREFYAQHGVDVEFVGHPLSELEMSHVTRVEFSLQWGVDARRTWIALLPGSRRKELRLNLPAMLGAAARLGSAFQYVMPVASTLDKEWVREQIASCGYRVEVMLTDDARASLLHARAAVVASGTATVEAALIGTPFVMVYRVARLTWALGRHLVNLPHYGMVNLVAGREVVPELIQDRFTPANVEREVRRLLDDGEARRRMIAALAEVRGRMGDAANSVGLPDPAHRAAAAVLRVAEMAMRKRE
jgi:lipid-A-disaccharide synthase